IRLWQRIAETSDAVADKCALSPIAVIPTQDSAVVETFSEVSRFRLETLPPDPAKRSLKDLQNALIDMKKDRYQRENLAWECADCQASALRAGEFIEDLSRL